MSDKRSLLIADADEHFLLFVTSLLQPHPYSLTVAKTAPDAARLLHLHSFDLLLTDPALPGNSELELVAAASRSSTPTLLVVGDPAAAPLSRAFRLPVVGCLTKPPRADELLSDIRRALSHKILADSILHLRQQLADRLQDLTLLARAFASNNHDPAAARESALSVAVQTTLHTMNAINLLSPASTPNGSAPPSPSSPPSPPHHPLSPSAASPRHPDLQLARAALRNAVDTLERTKSSFKSKELGNLRRELQAVLNRIDATPPL